ncbi:outer membrane lipoprotein chaperone LolA [Ramlibacter sp. H39-3-26]|uniref:outer membrane lipoprotein chaperone LolA n=1 Tax=Curvibacter soli TaxID=3031331 RepID=UPI0023DC0A5C|nr:outer membrane lipoprotein chaperone LolA [Ramlibacter sp. H39-3-26]MDF1486188.1 outer membrane lipoprotein chaperone LolA [Ramlibacter sp. H39-3-26]
MKKIFAILLIAFTAGKACADGLKDLEDFMRATHSGRADFTQVVTAPSRDGQAGRTRTSSGIFAFERPGKFRFTYQKPFAQTIVADGQTLWLYDADLNQVTQRTQAQALGSTPAALLASAPDLAALRRDYQLDAAPDADGLQWVLATPRAREGQLQSVRVGFRGAQLAALDILDSFGQRSAIRFANFQTNAPLEADTFRFKPPAGADVLKQ